MFLKKLTLKGFKSFAETTTLEFQPGITVVVGPNGSGKSNVVDAVAWVLGAQGPRSLRSSKMEDVIFAGSSTRPALGRAEVALTIDNSSGLLPVDLAEVTLTRTLFRSGESEYAINGAPCRLLDVQELLYDTGVGRQQHVIVSQGQLDAVLNSRPEDRRLLVEEAAGVLKYRRRREKAQRRLQATDGDVLRLQDLLRELRRQLAPLERQARAARRHDELHRELRAIRLHLAGRELAALKDRLDASSRARATLGAEEAAAAARLERLDREVAQAEASLTAPGAEALDEALARARALRERVRGVATLVAERRRSLRREIEAGVGEERGPALEAEMGRLEAELSEVERQAAELAPEAERLAAAQAALAGERAGLDRKFPARPAPSEAAEVRGELAALRRSLDQGRSEVTRLNDRLGSLGERAEELADSAERARAQEKAAEQVRQSMAAEAAGTRSRLSRAEAEAGQAEAVLAAARQEHDRSSVRAEALGLVLARAGSGSTDVEGVIGELSELVEVDDGWAPAFRAAVGEALGALVVDGVDVARAVLAGWAGTGSGGTVLPVDSRPAPAPGAVEPAAPGAQPLRPHVRARRSDVDAVLDVLLQRAVTVPGWQEGLALAVARPELVVVTQEGDRFSASGWRRGGAGAVTDTAWAEARSRAGETEAALRAAEDGLAAAAAERHSAQASAAEAAGRLEAADDRLRAAARDVERVEGEIRQVAAEEEAVRTLVDRQVERLGWEEARAAELEARLPALEEEEAAGAALAAAGQDARRRLEDRVAAAAALSSELGARAAGLEERRSLLARRLQQVREEAGREAARRAAAEERRRRLEVLVAAAGRLDALVAGRLAALETVLSRLATERQRRQAAVRLATERLVELRRERVATEGRLAEVRDGGRQAQLDEAEVRLRMEAAVSALERELSCGADDAMAAGCPELPPGIAAEDRAGELERELHRLGPVNPLALEEHRALAERHSFTEAQLEDVRTARRDLAKVIRAIDGEIADTFSGAFADVSENFARLFSTLFPGGTGRLRLTDPGDLLETGIEMEARPAGKQVRKLSLLSGGERSLTALAFLFAIFRSRPSPFYLLDEVEAALDDVNLHRFLDLLREFRPEAQLVVVSHQKRTMEAADCLYGVTMQAGGTSRVVSERLGVVGAGR